MLQYQRQFIDFAVETGVLKFGRFTLKSGRQSPYFFNAGLFDRGAALARLGRFYAEAITASGIAFDALFGPAYKGIPLAATTAIALADCHGRDLPYAFNRKEAKDHGEGGTLIGAQLTGRILIVDDVITAGTSVRESVEIITAQGAEPAGVVIALDRQERGTDDRSAVEQVRRDLGLPVTAIVTLENLLELLRDTSVAGADLEALVRYRDRFGTHADQNA